MVSIHTWQMCTCSRSMRFTSGATPVDLLTASMEAQLISAMKSGSNMPFGTEKI